MVFALLIAAIIWNVGTWYFGIPNSSSHALIGSIIGVGLMNQLMGGPNGTSGVDWGQALGVVPLAAASRRVVGFVLSALLLLLAKVAAAVPHALQGAGRRAAAALVDPRLADPDLHRRQLRPRLE